MLRIRSVKLLPATLAVLAALAAPALGSMAYSLEEGETLIGWARSYTVSGDETLHEAAVKTGMGYNEIADANPGVDPWIPGDGARLVIPSLWVLPRAPREGIVINLAEMRLFHYIEAGGQKLVRTYPVGIGSGAFDTPTGPFTVTEKIENPSWHVPESVRKEDPSLPEIMPPGPDNPLGAFALRLSDTAYLVHGTNRPFGIGRRVSHGCIRMYPDDIEELYRAVEPGTPVWIVYQPVKAGRRGGVVYVEVHKGYLTESESLWDQAVALLTEMGLLQRINPALLREALDLHTGAPVGVSAPDAVILRKRTSGH